MQVLFSRFVKQRRYEKGVSSRTEQWYWQSWRIFESRLASADLATLAKSQFSPTIEALLTRGVSPITVNSYTRPLNAFLAWLQEEGHLAQRVRIPRLKEPEIVIPSFRPEHIERLIRFRPSCLTQRRAHVLSLLLLDTGMRIKEALALRADDVDFDNLLITIRDGKGSKQRVVPFTAELRRLLFRFVEERHSPSGLVFFSGHGTKLLHGNIRRDFETVCKHAGIAAARRGFHVLRHTFALTYVRNGGDVFRLQQILGHATLDMTRRYVNLQTEDLTAVHSRLSPLARITARTS